MEWFDKDRFRGGLSRRAMLQGLVAIPVAATDLIHPKFEEEMANGNK
jgi:hypothetical protein